MASHSNSTLPVRIVIADDHPIFRDGLRRLIETRPEFQVIATVADGDEALSVVADADPDVLLLDLAMPRMAGLVALRELRSAQTRTKVILCTAAIDRSDIAGALQLGANGVVLKQSASD